MERFRKGINLGGWLSQYDVNEKKKFTKEQRSGHFEQFIKEEDISRIAGWGADHVRLPVDGEMLLESWKEGCCFIDRCLEWCEKYQLGVILDLHEIRGHQYGLETLVPLLQDTELQNRMTELWVRLTEYFRGYKGLLMFELLNEITDITGGYAWNRLCRKLITVIRAVDPERMILVGSNLQNSVFELKALPIMDDPNIMYNFHFYEPIYLTHQKAHFSEDMMLYHRTVHYPGQVERFADFLLEHREYAEKYKEYAFAETVDRMFLEKLLTPAFYFQKECGGRLYCGEFGVINQAGHADVRNYASDVADILRGWGIGYAYWNYKEMDFGVVDRAGNITESGVIETIFG